MQFLYVGYVKKSCNYSISERLILFVVIHAYMAIPERNHQGDVLNIVTTHLAMSLFQQLGLTKLVGVARRSKQAWKV